MEVSKEFYDNHSQTCPNVFSKSWVWYNKGYGYGSYYYYFKGDKKHPLYKEGLVNQEYLKVKGIDRADLPAWIIEMIPTDLKDVKVQGSGITPNWMEVSKESYGYCINEKAYSQDGNCLSIDPKKIRAEKAEQTEAAISKKINDMYKDGGLFHVFRNGDDKVVKVAKAFNEQLAIFWKNDNEWRQCYASDKSYILNAKKISHAQA